MECSIDPTSAFDKQDPASCYSFDVFDTRTVHSVFGYSSFVQYI